MPDLALGTGRPYSLVTTVVHRGGHSPTHCKLAQVDLHLTSGDLRLRFLDRESIARLYLALGQLAQDAYYPSPADYRAVLTRIFTDEDDTPQRFEEQFMPGFFDPF